MSRSTKAWRSLLSREFLLGGWSPDFWRANFTLLLSGTTVVTCIIQSNIGWEKVLKAVGFVPAAALSPSSWLSWLPGQSLPVALTWITYVFPHVGWGHIAGNVVGLLIFGGVVESRIGRRKYAAVVLFSVILGVFALAVVHPRGTEPIGGGSLLLCTVLGIWSAMYLEANWRIHPAATLRIEMAAVAALSFWLMVRTAPSAPSLFLAVMWHIIPLMAGWFWYRIAGAAPRG